MITKESTVGMTRDDWVKSRKNTIGGSDAASIIGLGYETAYTVWAEKLNKLPPKEDSEAMRQGRDLEEYVAKRFEEKTGKKVHRDNHIYSNSKYPFAHANIDRAVVGEDAGLECKTTKSLNLKKFKNGEFPVNYYVQCVHYMAVTGKKKWYLACLVFGEKFYTFEIERDQAEIDALMKSEEEFYEYIKNKKEPPVDGSEKTEKALPYVFPGGNTDTIPLEMIDNECEKLYEINKRIKELESMQRESQNKIKDYMGDFENGENENYRITWRTQTRNTFDHNKLMQENQNSNIDFKKYFKTTQSRVFKFNKKELDK